MSLLLAMVLASAQQPVPSRPDITGYTPPTPGCNVGHVYFSSGSTRLDADSRGMLDQLGRQARALRFPASIAVIGHADRVGSQSANRRLGERRARAVRVYLTRYVPAARIGARSVGEEQPTIVTPDGVAEVQNRLVNVMIVYAPEEIAMVEEWHRINGPWRGIVC